MTQVTFYGYDDQHIFTAPVSFDPYGPCPINSVAEAPPATTGTEVAQWQGIRWVVLAERPPEPAPPPAPPEPPVPPEPVPAPVILNKVDFLRLFTQTERINIRGAASVNPVVADYQYMLDAAVTVNLGDHDILNGIPLLEAAGLIGSGRAAQILADEMPA